MRPQYIRVPLNPRSVLSRLQFTGRIEELLNETALLEICWSLDMIKHRKRIVVYVLAGAVAILVASLFLSWANPLDKSVKRLLAEYDLTQLNFAAESDETGFSSNMYYFDPGEEVSLKVVEDSLMSGCNSCSVEKRGDYLIVQDTENFDDVRLQVEYVIDPGWEHSTDKGALLTVTRYGPPRRTLWDWIGGIFG